MKITITLTENEQVQLNQLMEEIGCPDIEHLILHYFKKYRHSQAIDDYMWDVHYGRTKEYFDSKKYQEMRIAKHKQLREQKKKQRKIVQ